MTREHEPSPPSLLALSRLTQAIGRIQGASTDEESLQLLGDAARELVSAERADDELTFERYVSALHPDDKDYVFAGITKATDPHGKLRAALSSSS